MGPTEIAGGAGGADRAGGVGHASGTGGADSTGSDGRREWPRPSLAVDVAVLTVAPLEEGPQLALLVLRRDTEVFRDRWDIPGVFVRERERLSDAVRRALSDKAGIDDLVPAELGVFDEPERDPRGWVVSMAYSVAVGFARLEPALADGSIALAPIVAGRAGEPAGNRTLEPNDRRPLVAPTEPPVRLELPDGSGELPFDHESMVTRAIAGLRERYAVRPDPGPVPEPDPDRLLTERPFTISELRGLYETILGARIQRDAFARRFVPRGDSGLPGQLRATGRYRERTGGRPAALYDFG